MPTAPVPTESQLAHVRQAIGAKEFSYSHRLEGALGSTMDVLRDGSARLVLRRYQPSSDDDGAELREVRALELMQRANVAVPAPVWVDTEGVFEEPAMVVSFVDARPDLTPAHPFQWAEEMAGTLSRVHDVRLEEGDLRLFDLPNPTLVRISEEPEAMLEHPLGEDLLRRHLELGRRHPESPAVFCHGDFWPGNVLWRGGQLAAVVDWEEAALGARAMDVAYCALDIRYLDMDRVADRFVQSYLEESGGELSDLHYWESVGLCRPLPDIGRWVPAWLAMGRDITKEAARDRYTRVLADFLERTG